MPKKARVLSVQSLPDLIGRLRGIAGFGDVVLALSGGKRATVDGAWGSSCALVAAALAVDAPRPLVVVQPRIRDVDDFAADLDALLDETPLVFPAWESLPNEHNVADAVFGGRLQVLSALEGVTPPGLIVTGCLPALIRS